MTGTTRRALRSDGDEVIDRVHAAMVSRGITQADLASRSGLSNSYLSHLFGGRIQSPAIGTVEALARGLEVTPAALIGRDGPYGLQPFPMAKSCVYFIRRSSDGAIKIGTSIRPIERLRSLRCASADSLELLAIVSGGLAEERALHRRFASARIMREWFRPTTELSAFIAQITQHGDAEPADGGCS